MPITGITFDDIDYNQIGSVVDIADKKVNTYGSPTNIEMNLSLAENPNKIVAVQHLLSELDKRNLWGKIDINFTNTKFSSEEIDKITKSMEKYKDKPINFSFDTQANNFSAQDIGRILTVCNGSKSTLYPFTSMRNDGLSSELRQKFLDNNPNIIQTGGNNPNLQNLKKLLGFSSNDIRGEIVNGANGQQISASEYAKRIVSLMDVAKIKELGKYTSALERLSYEYSALSIGNLQKKGYDDENVFFLTIKDTVESKLQIVENNKNKENNQQLNTENNKDTIGTDNMQNLSDKYFNLIETNTGTAEELWNMAERLEQNDKDGEYTKYAPYAIVDRDPTFMPQRMFNTIASNANNGYVDEFNNDLSGEIGAYIADVHALDLLAEHNPDLASSSRLLNTLNKISKETVNIYKGDENNAEVRNMFETFAINAIPAYGKCKYDTPKQATVALDNVTNIAKNLDTYARNPHDVINTVQSIVNNSDSDKDVAKSAFSALNLVYPQNSEEASKMLSLYRTISLENPDMAEASIMKMHKIFKNFSQDEKIQRECLSTIQNLNGFRGQFDKETQQKIDIYSKSMKNTIDAETIKRVQGKETNWKSPTTSNSQRSYTNTQSHSNFGNTYGGR